MGFQPCQQPLLTIFHLDLKGCGELFSPTAKSQQGMSGDVGTTAVERQFSPALAESWHSAVVVLQSHQPLHSRLYSLATNAMGQVVKSDECPGCIVTIRHTAREVAPSPSTSFCAREWMLSFRLVVLQPTEQEITIRQVVAQHSDAETCQPSREVGVDRPRAISSHGVHKELRCLLSDGMLPIACTTHAHTHKRREWCRLQESTIFGLQAGKHFQA